MEQFRLDQDWGTWYASFWTLSSLPLQPLRHLCGIQGLQNHELATANSTHIQQGGICILHSTTYKTCLTIRQESQIHKFNLQSPSFFGFSVCWGCCQGSGTQARECLSTVYWYCGPCQGKPLILTYPIMEFQGSVLVPSCLKLLLVLKTHVWEE